MPNLIEGLQHEMNRVRSLMPYYDLPNGAGTFALAMMQKDIKVAEEAIATGDTIQMMRSYEALKTYSV